MQRTARLAVAFVAAVACAVLVVPVGAESRDTPSVLSDDADPSHLQGAEDALSEAPEVSGLGVPEYVSVFGCKPPLRVKISGTNLSVNAEYSILNSGVLYGLPKEVDPDTVHALCTNRTISTPLLNPELHAASGNISGEIQRRMYDAVAFCFRSEWGQWTIPDIDIDYRPFKSVKSVNNMLIIARQPDNMCVLFDEPYYEEVWILPGGIGAVDRRTRESSGTHSIIVSWFVMYEGATLKYMGGNLEMGEKAVFTDTAVFKRNEELAHDAPHPPIEMEVTVSGTALYIEDWVQVVLYGTASAYLHNKTAVTPSMDSNRLYVGVGVGMRRSEYLLDVYKEVREDLPQEQMVYVYNMVVRCKPDNAAVIFRRDSRKPYHVEEIPDNAEQDACRLNDTLGAGDIRRSFLTGTTCPVHVEKGVSAAIQYFHHRTLGHTTHLEGRLDLGSAFHSQIDKSAKYLFNTTKGSLLSVGRVGVSLPSSLPELVGEGKVVLCGATQLPGHLHNTHVIVQGADLLLNTSTLVVTSDLAHPHPFELRGAGSIAALPGASVVLATPAIWDVTTFRIGWGITFASHTTLTGWGSPMPALQARLAREGVGPNVTFQGDIHFDAGRLCTPPGGKNGEGDEGSALGVTNRVVLGNCSKSCGAGGTQCTITIDGCVFLGGTAWHDASQWRATGSDLTLSGEHNIAFPEAGACPAEPGQAPSPRASAAITLGSLTITPSATLRISGGAPIPSGATSLLHVDVPDTLLHGVLDITAPVFFKTLRATSGSQVLLRRGSGAFDTPPLSLSTAEFTRGSFIRTAHSTSEPHGDGELRVRGDLLFYGSAHVALQDPSGRCRPSISAGGALRLSGETSFTCANQRPVDLGGAMAHPILHAGKVLLGAPGHSLSHFTHLGSAVEGRVYGGFLVGMVGFSPPRWNQVAGYLTCIAVAVAASILLRRDYASWGEVGALLKARPPVRADLPPGWASPLNLLALSAVALEGVWLFAVALHPVSGWSGMPAAAQRSLRKITLLQGFRAAPVGELTGDAFSAVFAALCLALLAWGMLWFRLRRNSTGVCHHYLQWMRVGKDYRGMWHPEAVAAACQSVSPGERRAYVAASAACSVLFIPMVLLLLAPLQCRYIVDNEADWMVNGDEEGVLAVSREPRLRVYPDQACFVGGSVPAVPLAVVSGAFVVLLAMLVADSPACRTAPLLHPPFAKGLQVRSRRAFDAGRVVFLTAQVTVLLVAEAEVEPVHMLAASLAVQACYFAWTLLTNPCIYRAVNQVRAVGQVEALWAVCIALAGHSSRPPDMRVCVEEEAPSYLLLGIWAGGSLLWASVVVGGWHCVEGLPASDLADELVARYKEVTGQLQEQQRVRVRQEQQALQEQRGSGSSGKRSKGTGSSGSKGDVTREVRMVRMALGDLLEMYAMPYYLGQPTRPRTFEATAKLHGPRGIGDIRSDEWTRGKLLGRGTFGSVYLAILRTGALAAVKVIDMRGDDFHPEDVQKEVEFMQRMRHPNVIEYKACVIDENTRCINIFMEYAVGGSLTSVVKNCSQRLTESVAVVYTAQVLTGLAFLHSNGVVHRDIKGENVLLDAQGRVKLADFGCAREMSTVTMNATFAGSPYWMAPEVIKNNGYNKKADTWSVGCTTIEILTRGSPPWKPFETVYAAMYHVAHSTEHPTNKPTDVSAECLDFFDKCFVRNPSNRPDASELMDHPWLEASEAGGRIRRRGTMDGQPSSDQSQGDPTAPDHANQGLTLEGDADYSVTSSIMPPDRDDVPVAVCDARQDAHSFSSQEGDEGLMTPDGSEYG